LIAAGVDAASIAALVKYGKDWYDRKYGSELGAVAPQQPPVVIQDNHGTIIVQKRRLP